MYTMDLPDGLKVAIRVDELIKPADRSSSSCRCPCPTLWDFTLTDEAFDAALGAIARGIPRARACRPDVSVIRTRWRKPVSQNDISIQEIPTACPVSVLECYAVLPCRIKDLLDQPWDRTLTELIPLFEADQKDPKLRSARWPRWWPAFRTRTGQLAFAKLLDEYIGTAQPPLAVRAIEGQTVVTRCLTRPRPNVGHRHGRRDPCGGWRGDLARRHRLGELFAASTRQALQWKVDEAVLAGPAEKRAQLRVRGAQGKVRNFEILRIKEVPKEIPEAAAFPRCSGRVRLYRPDTSLARPDR